MKRVLFSMVFPMLSFLFLSAPALADGMPGVRETPTHILVDVPKFCRPLSTEWKVALDPKLITDRVLTGKNDALKVLSLFAQKSNGAKAIFPSLEPEFASVVVDYDGGDTIRIPKDERIKFVGILVAGSPEFGKDNWAYTQYGNKAGNILSDPVRRGLWGRCD